jgi:21S rRNA (GM2251-2'-O)-methyltransferase
MNNFENGQNSIDSQERKTNLRALEAAGFEHLYGLAPVVNALKANKRDFNNVDSMVDLDTLEGEDLENEKKQRERKPEAQFTPWLFVQETLGKNGSLGGKTDAKAATAQEVEELAKQHDVPVAHVDKGVLNSLCGNRPHQVCMGAILLLLIFAPNANHFLSSKGYVLRCGKIEFDPMPQIPSPNEKGSPTLWLCLDEVVDPQNFGALLRSAYFLGGSGTMESNGNIGIMVCSKNSAPPTPVVSAASAGALEICSVHSTSNLPRTLNSAKEKGWRILGAAASAPFGMVDEATGEPVSGQDLNEVAVDESKPTILVLGSEGHGLRRLVAKACTGFVRIPGHSNESFDDEESTAGVDSLNVSVTGGIMLWHFLSGNK